MQTLNFSLYIVIYNLIIGVLIMIASEKLGVYAGYISGPYKKTVARVTQTAALAFGSCVAVLAGGIFVCWHLLEM